MVSIIIPNYNHAQYIGEAIRSVLNQEYRDFEIIVVDDGSTDNSREVIDGFGGSIRVIYQQNRGLSAARNTGLRLAKGSYIGFLDADDMYESNFLKSMISILQTNIDVDGIYCGHQFVDPMNNPLPQRETRLIPTAQLHHTLIGGNFLVPEAILAYKYCYENVGFFDETLSACEDWDMWLRVTSQFKIVGTSQVLVRHRILARSMSTDPIRMFNNRMAVVAKNFGEEPTEDEEVDHIKRFAYGRAYLISAVEYLQYQNMDHSSELMLRMANVCPSLLTKLDTFYELACGNQPKGFRGEFSSLDLQYNASILFNILNRMFNYPHLGHRIKDHQSIAVANANYALGLLHYGARRFQEARYYLFKAIIAHPRNALNQQLVVTLLKSLLNARVVDYFRRIRDRFSI